MMNLGIMWDHQKISQKKHDISLHCMIIVSLLDYFCCWTIALERAALGHIQQNFFAQAS
jgi:hypothetical protein